METTTVFERDGDFVSREVAGETILVPVRSGVGDIDSIYTLNEVGSVVWRELGANKTVEQIIDSVEGEFDTNREQAHADVLDFLQTLEARSLIRPAGGG